MSATTPTPGDFTPRGDSLRESAAAMLDPPEWKLPLDFRDGRLGDVESDAIFKIIIC
jgi:hypothetical protein